MADDERPTTHPFAYATIDTQQVPVLIAGWVKLPNAQGYYSWCARCIRVEDGEPVKVVVPADRLTRA